MREPEVCLEPDIPISILEQKMILQIIREGHIQQLELLPVRFAVIRRLT